MSERLVTERELEGILRRLNELETRLEREKSEVPIFTSGTWTPAFAGSIVPGTFTYASRNGHWSQDGMSIDIYGLMVISAIPGAPTGVMSITGLPFAASSLTNFRAGVSFGVISDFNYTGATTAIELTGVIAAGGSSILLFEAFDNIATVQVPAANFVNVNCNIQFSARYMKA